MKIQQMLLAISLLLLPLADANAATERALDYQIFDHCPLAGAYLYSQTEASGNSWVLNERARLPVRTAPAYTPGSSIELTYISAAPGHWQATLLHRPIRGQDDWDNGVFIQTKASPFKKAEFLHLRMRAQGVSADALPRIRLLLNDDRKSEALPLSRYAGSATGEWARVLIPLADFQGAKPEVSEQLKGIIFEQDKSDGVQHQLYIDQVDLRANKEPALSAAIKAELLSAKGFERHIDIAWRPVNDPAVCGTVIERSADGKTFEAVGFKPYWISRYADYLGDVYGTYNYRIRFLSYNDEYSNYSGTVSASTRQLNDEQLLDMVQEACARYYYDAAESESGMTLESVPGDPHMIATGASGFGIYSLVVAASRSFIPREKVAEHMLKILSFLERSDRFHGVMPHYFNGLTGHPKLFFGPDDDGGDLVETSFLMQGLLTARQFFDKDNLQEKTIREKITRLWEAVEWDWYKQKPDSNYLYWHWSPTCGWKINHRLIGWNESQITYLLAIAAAKHGVSPEMYYSGFASQELLAQQYRGDGEGKMYRNGASYYGVKLDVGGFSGGPIFFTHYNYLGMDPHGLRDRFTEYFENSKAICEINLRYCQANPQKHQGYGEAGWGMTASDGPWGYNPDEPRPEGDKGKLTPTGAIASMPYLPGPAMAELKNFYRNYGSFLWGEYGFRDAFNLDEHWVNDLYMGLNQGPMVVMIENYRTGLPWKLFGSNPEIKSMRQKVFGSK